MQQISNTFKIGGSGLRDLRTAGFLVLACWMAAVVVFAALPPDSGTRLVFALVISWTAAAFTAVALVVALRKSEGAGRIFWALLAGGMAFRFAGDVFWNFYEMFDVSLKTPLLEPQDFAYAISYSLLIGGLLWLIKMTAWKITAISAFDTVAIMLSTATLVWYFVLGPGAAAAGLESGRAAMVALSGPVCDTALLFLGLVVLSNARKPPLANLLIPGFLAFLAADALYLGIRSGGPYGSGNWSDMFWALGVLLVGLSALCKAPTTISTGQVEPWRILLFWFGPLSPPLHFTLMLAWGAFHQPLPPYVLAGAAIIFLYMTARVPLVSFVSDSISTEQRQMDRRLEKGQLLYELHDTVKDGVHEISLALGAALGAERRGERETTRESIDRALETSIEVEYYISKPYDEFQILYGDILPEPGAFLRHHLSRFEGYFGITPHEDLKAPLDGLKPGEVAAIYQATAETFWNASRKSGARNIYLESRQVGPVLIVRVRDDGRGLDPNEPPVRLQEIKRRAMEAGAEMDVISKPGRGTTVQLRFKKKY